MDAPVLVLDLEDFSANGDRRLHFADQVEQSLRTTGFFYLRNHGVDLEVINDAFRVYPRFFVDTPLEERMRYHHPEVGCQFGYTPVGVETGEHAKVADQKHFFHFLESNMPEVAEVFNFSAINRELFDEFQVVYRRLMRAVAMSLGLPEFYFKGTLGNSLLRVLHYPAQANPQTSDERVEELTPGGNVMGMCASRHTDINVLTLLLARQAGLQLRHDGEWMPMTISDPRMLIVNCGDMLEHLTGGFYRSAEHRVVCERDTDRYSMPFFGHFNPEVSLVPLSGLPGADAVDLSKFPHKTADAFLKHRLRQIGLLAGK